MKPGLIAFPFAYLQFLVHVNTIEAIVLQIWLYVLHHFETVTLHLGAVPSVCAAGK